MNIFIVSLDAVQAARDLCNRHNLKMIVETAQLLSAAHPAGTAPYRATHVNHPCAKWTRESIENYRWLVVHGAALCDEYTLRYGKRHKTQDVIQWLCVHEPDLPKMGMTPFARAIKEPWKSQTAHLDVVSAYRAYYIGDKARFARWAPRAKAPAWWPDEEA